MNNKGEEINKSNRFEIKVDIQATHPHYVLFADETGCNSSMKKMVTSEEQKTHHVEGHLSTMNGSNK